MPVVILASHTVKLYAPLLYLGACSWSPRAGPGAGAAADGVPGDLLNEDGRGEDLEGGADEVLGRLRVAEADDESLETRLAVCVAEEHDAVNQPELTEEAPEHHLLLPDVGEVPALQQDLVRDRDLNKEVFLH